MPGTIVPGECPCWTLGEITYYVKSGMIASCWYDETTHILRCVDDRSVVLLEMQKMDYCINYVTNTEVLKLDTDQWNACYSLLPMK